VHSTRESAKNKATLGEKTRCSGYRIGMGLVALLLILALIFGGIGLFVEGLKWLLIIALVLLVVSLFTGFRGRSSAV
jgi:heme A synthase